MSEVEKKPSYGPDDVRAEYKAVVDYHTAIVTSRFTIAGLYVAAVGFLAAAVFDTDTTWQARLAGSALALWLTVCLWILELRSRALFTNLAHRGIDIEHRCWGLTNEEWHNGFFSRQYKEPPGADADQEGALPRRREPDRPRSRGHASRCRFDCPDSSATVWVSICYTQVALPSGLVR